MLHVGRAEAIKTGNAAVREIEDHLLSVIYEKYLGSDLTAEEQRMMKQIDNDLLWYDLTNLLEEPQAGDAPKLHITLDYTVRPLLRWNRSTGIIRTVSGDGR